MKNCNKRNQAPHTLWEQLDLWLLPVRISTHARALAPDVYEAMLELGMTQQAAIFRRGLDMFGKAYIRDTEQRRAAFFNHTGWTDWDKALSALTDDFYALNGGLSFHQIKGSMTVEGGPGIDFAMLKYAREKKMLPC